MSFAEMTPRELITDAATLLRFARAATNAASIFLHIPNRIDQIVGIQSLLENYNIPVHPVLIINTLLGEEKAAIWENIVSKGDKRVYLMIDHGAWPHQIVNRTIYMSALLSAEALAGI